VLAALAASNRLAMLRAASSSCLGAALVLAPLAAPMRHAIAGVASSPLGAAVLLTPLAPAMRLAVLCIA
jgi:hypothetical protein